jgi:long-chain acyl-CoA synthetase
MSENVGAALERAARLLADREAVVDGETRWSYGELHRQVAGFDAALDRIGLAAGDVVGVLAMNSAAHLVAWLAIPRSGRVLNDLDFRLAPAELQFILADSGTRALIVDDTFLDVGRGLARSCPTVECLIYAGAGKTPDGCLSFAEVTKVPGRPLSSVDPDAIAGIFYTGGTTGLPKGAMLTHRNLVANAKHTLIMIGYDERDTYLHAAPMFHLADGASNYALSWIGGRHVIIPAFEPALWLQTVETEQVTRGLLVPTMINMVINYPGLRQYDLSSLRSMLYGASPMPSELLRRAMEAIPAEWGQAYGMIEAAPIVSYLSPEDHRRGATGEEPYATRLRSAGRPIVGVEAEVRRSDGSRAEAGEPGEIWVRGPNIMNGYWNRPQETAAAIDEHGWYRSGDAGQIDADGYLFIADRVKDMIISDGENVYSTEVENAIYQHRGVLECAVFGVPDKQWGERVHAAIVLKPGATADEDEIVSHCRALIASYKLPRSIDFYDEPLPKSGVGKILKRELRQHIPGARFVEITGNHHPGRASGADTEPSEIEEFLTRTHSDIHSDRVLATVLFTDIVDSTQHAIAIGDRRWRQLLGDHEAISRGELDRHRGQWVKSTGDGILATFDGPGRAVRCAQAIAARMRQLGLPIRSGIHTGEYERIGDDVGGVAVHIAARVAALAGPDQVLVSRTVVDLVAGSGLSFVDRGEHVLKGIPGTWQVFTAAP